MKDGAVLANAGHFDVEINIPDLASLATERRPARQNVEQFQLADGRRIYLLAAGRLVNLAAADGHPAEIMDMTFALQALAVDYVRREAGNLKPGVIRVARELDDQVARLRLDALGIEIDSLGSEQADYRHTW
jgi:adenosylhomocysteinase